MGKGGLLKKNSETNIGGGVITPTALPFESTTAVEHSNHYNTQPQKIWLLSDMTSVPAEDKTENKSWSNAYTMIRSFKKLQHLAEWQLDLMNMGRVVAIISPPHQLGVKLHRHVT